MLKYFLVPSNRTRFGLKIWWNSLGCSNIGRFISLLKLFLTRPKKFKRLPNVFCGGRFTNRDWKDARTENGEALDAICELLRAKHQEYAKDLEDIKVALNEKQTVQLNRVLEYVEKYRRVKIFSRSK